MHSVPMALRLLNDPSGWPYDPLGGMRIVAEGSQVP